MRSIRFGVLAAVAVCLMAMPFSARAGEPTVQLSATITDFVKILSSTPVSELQATGLPESARTLIFARFDFAEMAKRSLGSNWAGLDQQQQKEFVKVFTERMLFTYGRNVRSTGNEKVVYNREVQDGREASVETKVISGNGEQMPIDYRLHDIDGQWKVYDVVIDQVSVVNNFRAQFARVIAKSSVKDLLLKMKEQPQG